MAHARPHNALPKSPYLIISVRPIFAAQPANTNPANAPISANALIIPPAWPSAWLIDPAARNIALAKCGLEASTAKGFIVRLYIFAQNSICMILFYGKDSLLYCAPTRPFTAQSPGRYPLACILLL